MKSCKNYLLPFFAMSLLMCIIPAVLIFTLQEPGEVKPFGRDGGIVYGYSVFIKSNTRRLDNATTYSDPTNATESLNTTTIVFSLNSTAVEFLVIIGTVNWTTTSGRLLETTTSSVSGFDAVPMLRVTGDPISGTVQTATCTPGTDPNLAAHGLLVANQILVNQQLDAYTTMNFQTDSEGTEVCKYPETAFGTTFCPEYSQESTDATTSYKRVYKASSVQGRRLHDSLSMNIEMVSHVDSQTHFINAATTSGVVSFPVLSFAGEISMIDVTQSSSTTFDVQPNVLSSSDLADFNNLLSNVTFLPVDLSPENVTDTTNATRELAGAITTSNAIKLFSLFGVDVNLLANMVIDSNSLTAGLSIQMPGIITVKFANEKFGGPVVSLIWKILGLRNMVQSKLQGIQTAVTSYATAIQNSVAGTVLQKFNELKAVAVTLQTAFNQVSQSVQTQLNAYVAQAQQVVTQVQTQLNAVVTAGKQQIATMQQQVQDNIQQFKDNLQSQVTQYQDAFAQASAKVTDVKAQLQQLQNSIFSPAQLLQLTNLAQYVDLYQNTTALYQQKIADTQNALATYTNNLTDTYNLLINTANIGLNQAILDIQRVSNVAIQQFKDGYQATLANCTAVLNTTLSQIAEIQGEIQAAQLLVASPQQIEQLANLTSYYAAYNATRDAVQSQIDAIQVNITNFVQAQTTQVQAQIAAKQALVTQKVAALQAEEALAIQQYTDSLQPSLNSFKATLANAQAQLTDTKSQISTIKNSILSTSQLAQVTNLTNYENIYAAKIAEIQGNLTAITTRITNFATAEKSAAAVAINTLQTTANNTISQAQASVDAQIQAYKDSFQSALTALQATLATATANVTAIQVQITAANQLVDSVQKTASLANLNQLLNTYNQTLITTQNSIAGIQANITNYVTQQQSELAGLVASVNSALSVNVTAATQAANDAIQSFKDSLQPSVDSFTVLLSDAQTTATNLATDVTNLWNAFYSSDQLTQLANLTTFLNLYQSQVSTAQTSISEIQTNISNYVSEQQASLTALVTSIQGNVDLALSKLSAIANGAYSWQDEFQNAGLTIIDQVLKPFTDAQAAVLQAVNQIGTVATALRSAVSSSSSGFQSNVSGPAADISNGFGNINGQKPATTVAPGANVFDFSFMDTMINTVKTTLSSVSTAINQVKDTLNGNVLTVLTDVTNVLDPSHWVSVFANVKTQISAIETQYNFVKNAPALGELWIQNTVASLKSAALTQLSNANIVDLAKSLAPNLTSALLNSVVNISVIKNTLIQNVLSSLVVPSKKIQLYKSPLKPIVLGVVPTPIGPILISSNYNFDSYMMVAVALSTNKFAASLNPTAMASFSVTAAWNIYVAEVGAMAGVSLQGDFLFSTGMQGGLSGIFINGDLNFKVSGQFGLYYKYMWITIGRSCWSFRIGRLRITICIYWPIFNWSQPRMFLGSTINKSSAIQLLRKSF